MARARISPAWQKDMQFKIDTGLSIDVTTSYNPAAQWLISQLSTKGIPYKLHQLGAGVKRITTVDIDKCPCCGQEL